jgi:ribosome maturation factor RimP
MNGAQLEVRDTPPAAAGAARLSALRELVARTLAAMGYELVELERAGRGLLRVTLDVPQAPATDAQARHIGVEDCERVSRHLSHLFAVEDVDYDRLEVSSPGMDRPLRGARDFARFAGSMVKVQLFAPVEGRRRLRGRLLGLVDAAPEGAARVRLTLVPEAPPAPARGARRGRRKAVELETVEFALADVEKARLAPDWEFDPDAMAGAAPAQAKR